MRRKWQTQVQVLCNFIRLCLQASSFLLCVHCCSCYTLNICRISVRRGSLPLSAVFSPGALTLSHSPLSLLRTTSVIFTAGIPFGHLQHSGCCHKRATRLSLTKKNKKIFQADHKREKMSGRAGWVNGEMCKADEFWFMCGQNRGSFPMA